MARYDIEFATAIYVNIPVEAETLEEAQAIADKALTRHSIQNIELSDDMPEGSDVSIDSKGWELNQAEDIEDDETYPGLDRLPAVGSDKYNARDYS
jgi:hypothetical protein